MLINLFYCIYGNVLGRCDNLNIIIENKLYFVQHGEYHVTAAAIRILGFVVGKHNLKMFFQ